MCHVVLFKFWTTALRFFLLCNEPFLVQQCSMKTTGSMVISGSVPASAAEFPQSQTCHQPQQGRLEGFACKQILQNITAFKRQNKIIFGDEWHLCNWCKNSLSHKVSLRVILQTQLLACLSWVNLASSVLLNNSGKWIFGSEAKWDRTSPVPKVKSPSQKQWGYPNCFWSLCMFSTWTVPRPSQGDN